jgi:hypothetical protein
MKAKADKLIEALTFEAMRYRGYADKELKEMGETHNYSRLGGLSDGIIRAIDIVKRRMQE